MLIAAAYRSQKDSSGSSTIRGGALVVPVDDVSAVNTGGVSEPILPVDERNMNLDADGRPLSLQIDQETFTTTVESNAQKSRLAITSIRFDHILGTIPVVTAVTDDPHGFVEKYPLTQPLLEGIDTFAAEGMSVTVFDRAGQMVKMSRYQTGFRGGEGGVGPAYTDDVPKTDDRLGPTDVGVPTSGGSTTVPSR